MALRCAATQQRHFDTTRRAASQHRSVGIKKRAKAKVSKQASSSSAIFTSRRDIASRPVDWTRYSDTQTRGIVGVPGSSTIVVVVARRLNDPTEKSKCDCNWWPSTSPPSPRPLPPPPLSINVRPNSLQWSGWACVHLAYSVQHRTKEKRQQPGVPKEQEVDLRPLPSPLLLIAKPSCTT